jgi:hypothetical protein
MFEALTSSPVVALIVGTVFGFAIAVILGIKITIVKVENKDD